jgi:phosphate acyltransferase
MKPIAIDAMGGDRAPGEIVAGALQAAATGIPIVLVGPPDLPGRGELPLIEASEVIAMDEDPAGGVRRKKDSTLVRAAEAVRDGGAAAMISAGNTGATMAAALLRMGRIKGVSRPAVATPIPVPGSHPTILLDAGANAEVQPEWLVQFAQMGSVYSRHRFGRLRPLVGLLSIGEEAGKGTDLVREAHALLRETPLDFIGNLEAREFFSGRADVIVCDGFTGNIALKVGEGLVEAAEEMLREELGADAVSRIGSLLTRRAFERFKQRVDYAERGGAPLLGLNGIAVVGHGRSTPQAIENGIALAARLSRERMVERLADALGA